MRVIKGQNIDSLGQYVNKHLKVSLTWQVVDAIMNKAINCLQISNNDDINNANRIRGDCFIKHFIVKVDNKMDFVRLLAKKAIAFDTAATLLGLIYMNTIKDKVWGAQLLVILHYLMDNGMGIGVIIDKIGTGHQKIEYSIPRPYTMVLEYLVDTKWELLLGYVQQTPTTQLHLDSLLTAAFKLN